MANPNLGFLLGGVAKGYRAGKELSMQEQRNKLDMQKLAQEIKNAEAVGQRAVDELALKKQREERMGVQAEAGTAYKENKLKTDADLKREKMEIDRQKLNQKLLTDAAKLAQKNKIDLSRIDLQRDRNKLQELRKAKPEGVDKQFITSTLSDIKKGVSLSPEERDTLKTVIADRMLKDRPDINEDVANIHAEILLGSAEKAGGIYTESKKKSPSAQKETEDKDWKRAMDAADDYIEKVRQGVDGMRMDVSQEDMDAYKKDRNALWETRANEYYQRYKRGPAPIPTVPPQTVKPQ